jgi:hypothetical protein
MNSCREKTVTVQESDGLRNWTDTVRSGLGDLDFALHHYRHIHSGAYSIIIQEHRMALVPRVKASQA